MIRVNLLPISEARRRTAGRWQLAIFGILLLAELGGFVALYLYKSGQVEAKNQEVEQLQGTVQDLKQRVEETRKFEEKHDRLKQKQDTLQTIESESIGPGPMLRQLQVLLSEARNMEERHVRRDKGWNVEWDPNNLWIETLEESEKEFTLNGRAMDADDVAEFLQRLESASHFHGVKLDYVRPTESNDESDVVEFRLTGTVSYRAKRGGDEDDGDDGGDSNGDGDKGS